MKLFPTSTRFRVRRGAVIAGLLMMVFVVAAALAVQAYGNARHHRAQADRVLRDYAALSAARVAQRSALDLYWYSILPVLKGLQLAHQDGPQRPLPLPKAMSVMAMERPYTLQSSIRFSFRFDLLTKKLETVGQPVSATTRAWLPDTLIAHTRTIYDTSWHQGAILGQPGGERRYIAYTVLRDKSGALRTALGFDVDPASLRPIISSAIEKLPLLPPALTGGVQDDSMGSIIITDRYGVELYRSAVQYTSPFTARDTLGTDMGDLYAHTTLRAEVADQLIIGGLPRSRLPLILSLLGLTAVLIGIALFQLRRESQLARLRSDFISGVSHELRTPLAQIRMFSETLTLGRVRSDDERRRSLAIIDQEARRLTHLVENLLHFSRSERQTTHITPEPTKLAPLVQEVIDGFAPLAAARGATLAASVPEDLIVPADPGAVRQMLLNLLDNAVKYGPAGQEVRIGASRENGAARLWVDDGGPGIPRADRERVWVRFWRLERDRDSAVAGSGIGLAVVRELASLHHGRAWIDEADPATGAGTRVVIELPA
jgi:signal transduction histidine kinase